ncbi:glutamate receptor [Elysia marginata]|uniref:Glutamate receptor n=1 Tax=Elysia marginata TaxID=1093978 RepID=A0AAV4GDK0_9GAST|nr:glutamate receptor [Elysia marginata]
MPWIKSACGLVNRPERCRAGMWTYSIALSVLMLQIHFTAAEHGLLDQQPHYEIVEILSKDHKYDILMLDQDLATPGLVQAVVDSTPYRGQLHRVLMIRGDKNFDQNWCPIVEHFQTLWTAEESNGKARDLLATSNYCVGPTYSRSGVCFGEAVPLDEWVLVFEKRAKVILTIADQAGWNQFLLLFDEEYEVQARELLHLTSTRHHNHLSLRLTSLRHWSSLRHNLLQYFETSTHFNFVVLGTISRAEEVLQMVMSLEAEIGKRILVAGRSNWLLVSQGGLVHPGLWLYQSRFDNLAILTDPQDFEDLTLEKEEPSDTVEVLTTLLYKTGRRELAVVGSLDHSWVFRSQSDIFPNIKFGFNGRKFIITTNMWDPYVYRTTKSNGEYEYTGFCIDLAYELAKTLNFTIEFTEPPDGGWGADTGNGTWSGMVGQIVREEVDIIIAPIGVTMAREQVIDFTFAFFYDDSAVILKKPDPDKSKWRTYIDIFRIEVLYCIFVALVMSAALLTCLEYFVKRIYVFHDPDKKIFARTYLGSLLYLFGAMFNQGGQNLPYSSTGRVFISSWWLFCLVVAGTFGGNLIAVLTVTKDKPPFDTLAEMAGQSDYIFGTLGNSMWTTLFETSPRPEFQAISRKMEAFYAQDPSIYSYDPNVHLRRVKRGGYAYIADNGMFTSWLAYNCDLMILKEKFFPAKYAIGLPNNSAYTKLFSEQVVKVYESGLLQVWVKKWWPSRSFCAGSLVTEARTLNLKDVQSAFYLLGVGVLFAATLLLSEIAIPVLQALVPASLLQIKPDQESTTKKNSKKDLLKEKSRSQLKSWW